MLKDFLDKKEKGELLIQKTHSLYKTILNKVLLIDIYMHDPIPDNNFQQ
jgi:hypothetical protein